MVALAEAELAELVAEEARVVDGDVGLGMGLVGSRLEESCWNLRVWALRSRTEAELVDEALEAEGVGVDVGGVAGGQGGRAEAGDAGACLRCRRRRCCLGRLRRRRRRCTDEGGLGRGGGG